VFQLESRGMKELIKKLQPDCFEDMTALVALFRPGPLQSGMVDDFCDRKHGRAESPIPHPELEPILKPTYGVILYQEQVMQIAQVLAGYSLGGADLLRRAMGKKKVEEMDKQRAIFEQGAPWSAGVEAGTATYIFDLMEKFAGYGFNKSHSAAYALVSYQTLWLKAHYPAAFMAAVLSADMDNTDKVVTLIDECRSMGLKVEPPKVNRSEYRSPSTATAPSSTAWAPSRASASRPSPPCWRPASDGAFKDLWDFCRRVDLHKANKRVFEALIRAGALDGLGAAPPGRRRRLNRATLMNLLPAALASPSSTTSSRRRAGDLFGALLDGPHRRRAGPAARRPDLAGLGRGRAPAGREGDPGLYLTGHPINRFDAELNAMVAQRIGRCWHRARVWRTPAVTQLRGGDRDQRTVAGLVHQLQVRKTSRGRMASLTLDDRTGRIEVTCFNDVYEAPATCCSRTRSWSSPAICAPTTTPAASASSPAACRPWSRPAPRAPNTCCCAWTSPSRRTTPPGWIACSNCNNCCSLSAARARRAPALPPSRLRGPPALGDNWRVMPADALLKRLRGLLGDDAVEVVYERERAITAPPPLDEILGGGCSGSVMRSCWSNNCWSLSGSAVRDLPARRTASAAEVGLADARLAGLFLSAGIGDTLRTAATATRGRHDSRHPPDTGALG
jgi:DNA polymerase-3 subunit alpha